jgi:PhnB protein
MRVQPYLFFDGRCEEALRFYQEVLGAELVMMLRFKDSPDPVPEGMVPPGSGDKVMHCAFKIGETEVLASDGGCRGETEFKGFSLTCPVPDAAAADRMFAALGQGGQVQMPLGPTFFSPRFGIVADRFGVSWMVIVDAPAA